MGQTVATDRALSRLVDLVKTLRSDTGCPWDRAQTPGKIKVHLIEEAYEVLDALESGSDEQICGELGDLLFHIVFLARLFEEAGAFDIGDVLEKIVKKMIRRHPHVFGEAQVAGVEDVKKQWREIKATESQHGAGQQSALRDEVPTGLPMLMRACRLLERASAMGFESSVTNQGIAEIYREAAALKEVVDRSKEGEYTEKLGDLLLGTISLSRSLGVHPDTALGVAIGKFINRFEQVEMSARQQGRTITADCKPPMRKNRQNDKGRNE